jgi:hypothetical protein
VHTISGAIFRGCSATVENPDPRRIQVAYERIFILVQLVCRAAVLDVAGLETPGGSLFGCMRMEDRRSMFR